MNPEIGKMDNIQEPHRASAIKRAADEAEGIASKYEEATVPQRSQNTKKSKKKSALSVFAFIFFLLALLIAIYLLGVHYNLFPDFLAPFMDKAIPGADIISEQYTQENYELIYDPAFPEKYTEILVRLKEGDSEKEYVVYAFTNMEGDVEYRGYVRKTSVIYDLVTDELSEGTTTYNDRPVESIKDKENSDIFVYSDTAKTKIETGYVKLNLTDQDPLSDDKYYEYEIAEEDGFVDVKKEETGKCNVEEIPAEYEPAGANGIEAVDGYTSLFRVPVSVYTDEAGNFKTYYVYYIYGSFDGEKRGFYPADADGQIQAGGLMNPHLELSLKEEEND